MENEVTITYAITVKDELEELTKLLNFLQVQIGVNDEILIQYDTRHVSDEVLNYLKIVEKIHDNHKVIGFPFESNFADFKNNLKKHATKDYIFQLDADEIPHKFLVQNLSLVLASNPVDIVLVPRINTVDGLTIDHVRKWRWGISKLNTQVRARVIEDNGGEYRLLRENDLIISQKFNSFDDVDPNKKFVNVKFHTPIVNFPDYQARIYKVTDEIEWGNRVHETLTGYDTFSNFPAEESWCLYHHKDIKRQEAQNHFYDKLVD